MSRNEQPRIGVGSTWDTALLSLILVLRPVFSPVQYLARASSDHVLHEPCPVRVATPPAPHATPVPVRCTLAVPRRAPKPRTQHLARGGRAAPPHPVPLRSRYPAPAVHQNTKPTTARAPPDPESRYTDAGPASTGRSGSGSARARRADLRGVGGEGEGEVEVEVDVEGEGDERRRAAERVRSDSGVAGRVEGRGREEARGDVEQPCYCARARARGRRGREVAEGERWPRSRARATSGERRAVLFRRRWDGRACSPGRAGGCGPRLRREEAYTAGARAAVQRTLGTTPRGASGPA